MRLWHLFHFWKIVVVVATVPINGVFILAKTLKAKTCNVYVRQLFPNNVYRCFLEQKYTLSATNKIKLFLTHCTSFTLLMQKELLFNSALKSICLILIKMKKNLHLCHVT